MASNFQDLVGTTLKALARLWTGKRRRRVERERKAPYLGILSF